MPSAIFADRYEAVVAVLRDARQRQAITQVELAARLGRLQSYVSKVERRERRVDPAEFHDWAVALGIPPAALFAQLEESLNNGSAA